ncbi:MAG: MEDS domain-containing protein [Thermoplasmatota archaeon]
MRRTGRGNSDTGNGAGEQEGNYSLPADSIHSIVNLQQGDHLCCIYETEEEHQAVVTPYIIKGLEQAEKVMYLVDIHTAETILDYVRNSGIDADAYHENGQLSLLTRNESYVKDGVFDPKSMISLLRSETEKALDEGYNALRVTGEMTGALRGLPGSEQLIEYEILLNEFLPGSRCLVICQYDRRLDAGVLLDVLRTHSLVIIGTEVYQNFYYIPPEDLMSENVPAATLRRWEQNLADQKEVERRLAHLNETLQLTNKIMRHDILNDVQVARSALDLYLDEQKEELLKKIGSRLEQSMSLIKRMQELETLVVAGETLEPYRVRDVVEDVVEGYDVTCSIHGDCTVKADAAFPSVIDNLVENAVIHGEVDHVEVSMKEQDGRCLVHVADDGTGIPDDVKERVFEERFSHGGSAGSGLGLYIVKKAVERYGGSVAIEDNRPSGTVVVVELETATS